MKKWVIGSLIFCTATLIVVKYWWIFSILIIGPYKGPRFETWQSHNASFQIRVDAFHEENAGFVPGAYYTFLWAPVDSNDWEEVMTFRHDASIDIRKSQVHFVSDDVAFVYMGWMFASTHNGGQSWAVWDACKTVPDLKVCNYEGIKKVEIGSDGIGTMTVAPIPDVSPLPILCTEDYGRSWRR